MEKRGYIIPNYDVEIGPCILDTTIISPGHEIIYYLNCFLQVYIDTTGYIMIALRYRRLNFPCFQMLGTETGGCFCRYRYVVFIDNVEYKGVTFIRSSPLSFVGHLLHWDIGIFVIFEVRFMVYFFFLIIIEKACKL